MNATQLVGVIALAAAALLAFAAARGGRADRRGWHGVAIVHVLLAIEVVAKLRHGASGTIGRLIRLVTETGGRREVQTALIVVVVILAALALRVLLRRSRRASPQLRVAVIATTGLVLLFLVETVSLHALDGQFYRALGPVKAIAWGWLALSGISAMAAATARRR